MANLCLQLHAVKIEQLALLKPYNKLYFLGYLGVSPMRVEDELTETLCIAQLWDCIVLLDEADVLFTARNTLDLQRNAVTI